MATMNENKSTPNHHASITSKNVECKSFCDRISSWWNDLAKPRHVNSEEEIMKNTRNSITFLSILSLVIVITTLAKQIPLLLSLLVLVKSLGLICYYGLMREAILLQKDLEKTDKEATKGETRLLIVFLVIVLLLTAIAWAIQNGYFVSVVETFPLLKNFSNWQIEKINELFEFINGFF